MDIKRLIGGFFWTILFMLGNYLIEFFPPQLHKLLKSNMIVEHIVLFFLIYFIMEMRDDNHLISPFQKLYEAAIIYVFYLFFSKSTIVYSIIIILLLSVNFIIISQQKYLEDKGENFQYLNNTIDIISWVILGVMIISFLVYLRKQLREHKNFSVKKFIIGNKEKDKSYRKTKKIEKPERNKVSKV